MNIFLTIESNKRLNHRHNNFSIANNLSSNTWRTGWLMQLGCSPILYLPLRGILCLCRSQLTINCKIWECKSTVWQISIIACTKITFNAPPRSARHNWNQWRPPLHYGRGNWNGRRVKIIYCLPSRIKKSARRTVLWNY